MFKRILKRILVNVYLIRSINWITLWQLSDKKSDNIILLFPSYPKDLFAYIFSAVLINDFALINAMLIKGEKFKIRFGGKQLYNVKGKKVYHNLSKLFTFHEGKEYSDSLLGYQKHLEDNKNVLIPTHGESYYWENKIYMQAQFKRLDISHPATIVVDKKNPAPEKPSLEFPLLFKPAHASGSTGIQKLDTIEDYNSKISSTEYSEYLIQQWIDMRSDLRLIYVGDELVLHYWRLNESDEWKPTSTGRGSSVDFVSLPEQWMDFIFSEYKKLGLKTAAFDITWHKDDLSTKPLILEVSPSYMPNPAPVGEYLTRPYGEFKKAIWGKDAYYKKYIDLVFLIKKKLIKEYE